MKIIVLIFDRIIEYGVMFLIVFTPLAFGAVQPWAYYTMELTVCFLVFIWSINQIITTCQSATRLSGQQILAGNSQHSTRNTKSVTSNIEFNRFGLAKTPLNIPIILFISLILFQLIPLPSGILRFLSPNTHYLYSMSQPGWPDDNVDRSRDTCLNDETKWTTRDSKLQTPNSVLAQPSTLNSKGSIGNLPGEVKVDYQSKSSAPLSIYPYASKTELFKILAYFGMFFLIINTQGLRIKRILLLIICVGFCISVLGILQKLTGTEHIYWVRDASYATPFGPYVNRNHFAGYIGMVIPLALGMLVFRFAGITLYGSRDDRSIVAEFQSHFFANLLLIFIVVIMITALFFTASRGGILSFAVMVVVLSTLICLTRLRAVMGKWWRIIVSVMIITVVILIWLGLDPVLNRLSDITPGGRYEIYNDAVKVYKDFPLFGTGLGTFQYVLPGYRTIPRRKLTEHAHNDYLELVSDCGLIGLIIILSGIIIFFWMTMTRWWKRRRYYAKSVAMGGFCGIIAILAHSFVDFNLHIPANALFLSILLGLTYNVVNLKR